MPLLLALLACFIEPEIWFTRDSKVTPDGLLTALCCMAVMCILSALGVVLYHDRPGAENGSAL